MLALDTATPAVTAGVVELGRRDDAGDGGAGGAAAPPRQRSVRVAHGARKHAELLMPRALAACSDAGVGLRDVDAVVVGTGPGPFTGLRVGMVTAAALGDALGVPVHGVGSLDAVARDAGSGRIVVVTDARRREVYWAAYADGVRFSGPHVDAPAVLVDRLPQLGVVAAAGGFAHVTGLPVRHPESPSPAGLVAAAAPALLDGSAPGPLVPLYLRRPDAVEPGARKRVTA